MSLCAVCKIKCGDGPDDSHGLCQPHYLATMAGANLLTMKEQKGWERFSLQERLNLLTEVVESERKVKARNWINKEKT